GRHTSFSRDWSSDVCSSDLVVLVGVTGYGLATLFALQGAPDLAFTQRLVETVTLVAFVLVLRRLPGRIGVAHGRPQHRLLRAILGRKSGADGKGCVVGVSHA